MSADLVVLLPIFCEADCVVAKSVDGSCSSFVKIEFGAEVCKSSVLCCPCHCVVVDSFEFVDELVAEVFVPCFDEGAVCVGCLESTDELVSVEVKFYELHCRGAELSSCRLV